VALMMGYNKSLLTLRLDYNEQVTVMVGGGG
jgi:hypothetical protein